MHTNETVTSLDRMMMAVTFAEAGEDRTALDVLHTRRQKRPESRMTKQKERRPELRL